MRCMEPGASELGTWERKKLQGLQVKRFRSGGSPLAAMAGGGPPGHSSDCKSWDGERLGANPIAVLQNLDLQPTSRTGIPMA